ncbi:MAG: hypothetical protein HY516_04645 [Candidatus Aenigmarchaeota archaeon]|nr:hypothetical protein [Candidatus Aenigmarchaeota archaeon]
MKKTLLLVSLLAVLSGLSGFAAASRVAVTPTITDMGVCAMSFTNQLVKITNTGPVTDTYRLSSDNGMLTFAGCTVGTIGNNEVTLAAGETSFCSVFINPLNNTETRKYSATINADSGSSADAASARIGVDVLQCSAVSITTQENVRTCAREKFSAPIVIKNIGKSPETFNVSASSAGKFDRTEIELAPGQSGIVNFESTFEKVSNSTVKFVVKSKDSFASGEASLDVAARECFGFDASLSQPSGPICSRQPAEFKLNIRNLGEKPDVFEIVTASGLDMVSMNASSNATFKIAYQPEKDGRFRLNVSVKSVATDVVKNLQSEPSAVECASVSITPQTRTASVCTGEQAGYAIDIKNTGSFREAYSFNASKGTLSAGMMTIGPGDVKTVYLTANSTEFPQNRTSEIIFTASAGSMKNSTKLSADVGVCHNAVMGIKPPSLNVCTPDKAMFKVEINNTGKRPEAFAVFAAGKKIADNVLVMENSTKSVDFAVDYSNETGIYRVDADAVSQDLTLRSAAALVVRDYNACYGASLTSKNASKAVKPSDRALQELQLRNTGIKTLNYILQLVGPQWMAVGVSNITLEPNETGKVYLYIAPPFGTTLGNYETKVIAISDKGVSSGADFTASVVETTAPRIANATTTTMPAVDNRRNTVIVGIILAMAAILILRHIFTSK